MCDPNTLKGFLSYAKDNVAADRYVLVFWGHGYGTVGGFGRDELHGNKSISVSDLKSSLDAFGKKFDLIVFDACLIGTLECAYALKDHAEYMIASEYMTPTDGLYYTTWLNSLSANPRMKTEVLARMIVDAFVVHAPPARNDVMLSVIRLSNIDKLVDTSTRAQVATLMLRYTEFYK